MSQAVRPRLPLGDGEPVQHSLDLLDLGPSIDPGRARCLARAVSLETSSSTRASAAQPVIEETNADGGALVQLLRRTLAPRASDHPGPTAGPTSPSDATASIQSTSLSVAGGPDERLTWSGNGAVWTKGAELVRSFVFEPDELVAAAAFASFSLESAACRASEDVSGGPTAAAAEATSDRSVPTPQPPARARARPSQVRRSSQARGPRVSEGASFVRQSTHPPAQADSSAFLQAPAPSAPLASVPAASGCAGAPLASKLRRRSSGPQTRALCFLFNDALHIHLASGERHILPLPCATEPSLQAIEGGGLALRSSQPDADVSFLDGGSLFVVRNPLDGFVLVGSDEKSVIAASGAPEAASGPAAQTAADQVPVELLLESGHVVTAQASQTTIRVPADPASSRPAVSAILGSTVELSGRQAWVPGLNRLDTLIRDCLRALDGVLAAEDLCGLRLNSIRSAGHASASSDESTRFASFTTALLDVLARDRSQPSPEPPAHLSPWERIVSFNELSRDPALQTLARSPLSSATPANNGIRAPVDLTRTAAVVLALHLLAEDYRLDILRFQDLHALGGIVAKLALAIGRSDWADHWFRQGCLSPVRDVHVASAGEHQKLQLQHMLAEQLTSRICCRHRNRRFLAVPARHLRPSPHRARRESFDLYPLAGRRVRADLAAFPGVDFDRPLRDSELGLTRLGWRPLRRRRQRDGRPRPDQGAAPANPFWSGSPVDGGRQNVPDGASGVLVARGLQTYSASGPRRPSTLGACAQNLGASLDGQLARLDRHT